MASINAKAVAIEVLETLGKGKKVNLGKIIRKNGYAKNTSDSPKQVTNTKTYKEATLPIVEAMTKERDRLLKALSKKNLSKEKYRDMVDGFDKITKNIQLLSGKDTERSSFTMQAENILKFKDALKGILS